MALLTPTFFVTEIASGIRSIPEALALPYSAQGYKVYEFKDRTTTFFTHRSKPLAVTRCAVYPVSGSYGDRMSAVADLRYVVNTTLPKTPNDRVIQIMCMKVAPNMRYHGAGTLMIKQLHHDASRAGIVWANVRLTSRYLPLKSFFYGLGYSIDPYPALVDVKGSVVSMSKRLICV